MVRLLNCAFDEFVGRLKNKKLYCFGYGDQAKTFFARHKASGVAARLCHIVDNNPANAGKMVEVNGERVSTVTFREFADQADRDSVMLVTSIYCVDILAQLDGEPRLDGLETYVNIFIDGVCAAADFEFTKGERKIPKKLHYCWFGGKPVPMELQKYMDTWRVFCPDYEIIRWDERNYDVTKNLYMKQAYDAGKWGFVPDYARLDIVYEHGGVYLDTDVEIVKNFDALLNDEMFCGFEQSGCVNFGNGFGAAAGNEVMRELRDVYDTVAFVNADGTFNVMPCPFYQEPTLEKLGVRFDGSFQQTGGVTVYPAEVLDGENHWSKEARVTEKTRALHHYASSWWGSPKMDEAAEKLKRNYGAILRRMSSGA